MDLNVMLQIRAQGLAQVFGQDEEPIDMLFIVDSSSVLNISGIPYEGDFPPSYKYNVRKHVVGKILDKSLSPYLQIGKEAYFFSYDSVYDVDYAFVVNLSSLKIDLYISRNGKVLKKYYNFNLSTDERNGLMNL